MKHIRPDYNRIQDPAGRIPANEPVFLVRGQDRFGWIVAVVWAMLNYLLGQDKRLTKMALRQAVAMFEWPKKQFPDYGKRVDGDTYAIPDATGHYPEEFGLRDEPEEEEGPDEQ